MHGCNDCLSNSTAHGISNITTQKPLSIRIFWILFTVIAFVAFSYHTYTLALKLIEKPVAVRTIPQIYKFYQPDILICFERILSKSVSRFLLKDGDDFALSIVEFLAQFKRGLYFPKFSNFDSFYKAFRYQQKKLKIKFRHLSKENKKILHDLYASILNYQPSIDYIVSNLGFNEMYKLLGYRAEELIIKLRCAGREVKLNFEINYKHLACLRFNKSVCDLNTEKFVSEFYIHSFHNKSIAESNLTFDGTKLYNLRFAHQSDSFNLDGIFIYTDIGFGIDYSENSFVTATGGYHTYVTLTSHIFNYINRKKFPCSETCHNLSYYNLLQPGNLMQTCLETNCIAYKMQMQAFKSKECALVNYFVPTDLPHDVEYCFSTDSVNNMNSTQYESWVINLIMNATLECVKQNKPQLCKDVFYDMQTNSVAWPISQYVRDDLYNSFTTYDISKIPGKTEAYHHIKNDPSVVENYKKNYYKITIGSAFNKNSLTEEIVTYKWKDFVADVGGIMGLYLGASVLTVVEIINVFTCYAQKGTDKKELEEDMNLTERT